MTVWRVDELSEQGNVRTKRIFDLRDALEIEWLKNRRAAFVEPTDFGFLL
jgi:hypothetical protein